MKKKKTKKKKKETLSDLFAIGLMTFTVKCKFTRNGFIPIKDDDEKDKE